MMNNPLLDEDFLKRLFEQRERTVYARIVALNMQEEPMEEISGRVTQGSINVDGNSSVRRSFSLSMVAHDININDYYWGLNTKVKLFIGLKNTINEKYDDIVWFKQGTYILSTFNTSQSVNNYSISVNGKDKMCKLNGELGGMIESLSADFGKLKSYTRDEKGHLVHTEEDIPIKTIIREAVHKYGNEPFQNIIINDIDEYGLELMEYRGDKDRPLYMLIDLSTNEISNITFDGEQEYIDDATGARVQLKNIPHYDPRMSQNFSGEEGEITKIKVTDGSSPNPDTLYSVGCIKYGEVCGYRLTDLTYPGDLTAKVGDAITSILDKIKNMLGDFEYFYDLDGHFVFQKRKTYTQTPFNGIIDDGKIDTYVLKKLTKETYLPGVYYTKINGGYQLARNIFDETLTYYEKVDGAHTSSAIDTSDTSFFFGGSNLVTSFQNTPNLTNLKNDFSIWGAKKAQHSDATTPIHLRYAIDKKPIQYTTYDGLKMFTIKTYDEVVEELTQKYEGGKTPNTNGLPEEWWDVHEWAEVYRIRTGEYPKEIIGNYCTPVALNVYQYFNPGGYYTGTADTVITTDDVFYYVDTNQVASIHGICGHTYTYYIEQAQNGIGAYIHNPQIPDAIIDKIDGETLYDGKTEVITEIDWREIIYQMAIDYNNNCHKDDFMIKVYQNNEGLFNEDGTTGYESYYTDMEGFWRELYDPRPPVAGGADFIRLINEVISDMENKGFISNTQMKDLGETFFPYFKKNTKEDRYELKTKNDYMDEQLYASAMRNFWKLIRDKQYPDDGIQTFYRWNPASEIYEPRKFEEAVELLDIPSLSEMRTQRGRLYMSPGGNTYYELKRYDEERYFQKAEDISLGSMQVDKTYYYTTGDEVLTFENCNSHIWNYANAAIRRENYPSTESYEAALTEGPNGAFIIGRKYFEYAGYKRAGTLEKGIQYYTRREISEGNYAYDPAIKLDKDLTYYSEDPGLADAKDIRVQTFTRGNTYYTKDAQGNKINKFTYDREITYYQDEGFKMVLDLSKCGGGDRYFYSIPTINTEGKSVHSLVPITPLDGNFYLPRGQVCSHYKHVPVNEVKNGKYYTLGTKHQVDNFYNDQAHRDAIFTDLRPVFGTAQESSVVEQMKNNSAKYGPADYIDLALLDLHDEVVANDYASEVLRLNTLYLNEVAAALSEDRDVRMSKDDLDNSLNKVVDEYGMKLAYTEAERYAVDFRVTEAIRTFEYNKRYYTRHVTGTDSDGNPMYEYLRYNCYRFKERDENGDKIGALYSEAKYNINTGWALDLQNDPANLIFWFDFLDTDGDVSKYSVKTVGNRPKAVNDEKVKAIYYRDTPNVIFVNADDWETYRDAIVGYTYVRLPYDLENLFHISARGKTAHAQLEEFLYQFTYCTETISMTTVPVYHLQPNTRIAVRDDKSHINGDYLITRLTIPLTYNGTMNISATKAADTIY